VRKFVRRDTVVAGPRQQYQADLIDIQGHKRLNEGCKYILTVIDVFSKRAWAEPLKIKTGVKVAKALDRVLLDAPPKTLQTDKGKEFLNSEVRATLSKHGVSHFTTENSSIKASVVERFNRTLRNTIHRNFTRRGEEKFLDVLPDILKAYNNRWHSSLDTSPARVDLVDKETIWYRLYDPTKHFESPRPKLEKGDYVRISKARTVFLRGYTPNWSVEVFRVDGVLPTSPVTYTIVDWGGEEIKGTFYEQELQKVKEPAEFKVEKVLRRKKEGGKNMAFVKWLSYPDKFNQWISEDDFTN
jgi:hypothetical protein